MRSVEPGCAEMELLLQADLDGELDTATTAILTKHMMSCEHCAKLQKQLQQLRQALRNNALYEKPGATFSNALRQQMGSELSGTLRVFEPRKKLSQGWKNTGLVAAGAALAASLLLAVMPIGYSPVMTNPLLDNVVAEHVRSLQADHLFDVASTDQHTVKPWFNGKLDFVPPVIDFSDQGFSLVGGRLDYLAGRNVAALVYRHGQHPINLFTWPSEQVSSATAGCKRMSGYHVCSWNKDAMNFWVVSDIGEDEMKQFVALWTSK